MFAVLNKVDLVASAGLRPAGRGSVDLDGAQVALDEGIKNLGVVREDVLYGSGWWVTRVCVKA